MKRIKTEKRKTSPKEKLKFKLHSGPAFVDRAVSMSEGVGEGGGGGGHLQILSGSPPSPILWRPAGYRAPAAPGVFPPPPMSHASAAR